MDDRIERFLTGLEEDGDDRFLTVTRAREVFRERFPHAEETLKYGGIHYLRDGAPFAGIYAYTKHVSVEINGAAAIEDVFGFLEGAGGKSGRKHVRLDHPDEVAAKRLAEYLALAWDQRCSSHASQSSA